jgi:hypothetical protein
MISRRNVRRMRHTVQHRSRGFDSPEGRAHHDGRFATMRDVAEHYNAFFSLSLTEQED